MQLLSSYWTRSRAKQPHLRQIFQFPVDKEMSPHNLIDMKIKSLCAERSDAAKLVLRTDPPLTMQVLDHFRQVQQRQTLAGFAFSLDAGCLVVHNVIPTSLNIDTTVADDIKDLLNAAEEAAGNTERLAREAVERENSEKRASVDAAAKAFGIPAE